jgi:hypothetical protein
MEQQEQARRAAFDELLERESAAGDEIAKQLIILKMVLHRKRRPTIRSLGKAKPIPPRLEQMLNPTRVVQSLAKRCLIRRDGHGGIALTAEGRAYIQQLSFSQRTE